MRKTEKQCTKCGIFNPLSEFHKKSRAKDGLSPWCKTCCAKSKKDHYERNKKKIRAKQAKWYEENKEKHLAKNKQYYEANRERQLEYRKEYRKKNADKIRQYRHDERTKQRANELSREKYHNNIAYRLSKRVSNEVWKGLNRTGTSKAGGRTWNHLPYNPEELKQHVESLFQEGMSWENYGEWHVDHRKPCSSFDLVEEDEQRKCFHYTNLQPMWAIENLSKWASFDPEKFEWEWNGEMWISLSIE